MKSTLRQLTCLCAVLVLLFALSVPAFAASTSITSLHFDIVLQADGSAKITETRVASFFGDDYEFSRFGLENSFTGPRVFRDWQVSLDGQALTRLEEADDENRPENTFAVTEGDGENTLTIYHRSTHTSRTFTISYVVENAVELYSDAGVFFWNLNGKNYPFYISKITADVSVPDGVAREDFRIWAHGPLNGTFEKQNANSAHLQVESVGIGEIVDIRVAVPASFFTGGWQKGGEGLPDILAEEQVLADKANALREEEAQKKAEQDAYWAARGEWEAEHPVLGWLQNFCGGIADFFYYNIADQLVGIVAGTSIFGVILSFLFSGPRKGAAKLRYKANQEPQYYRNLPDDRPAPSVDRLVHYYGRPDTARQISATLLELNLKKLIHFESDGDSATLVLDKKLGELLFPKRETASDPMPVKGFKMYRKGEDVVIESSAPASEDPGYQETLWRFLVNAAEEDDRLSVKALKKYVKNNQETAYYFNKDFENAVSRDFLNRVKTETVKGRRLKDCKWVWILPLVVGVLGFVISLCSTLYDGVMFIPSLGIGILSFGIALLFSLILFLGSRVRATQTSILCQDAENDLALWQAFGRFLDDFTTFDRKELPEFPVWRDYMVYAVAMGKGKQVAKALAVQYPEAFQSGDMFDDEFRRYLENLAWQEAMASLCKDVTDAHGPVSSSDSGSWSDGSGGGGGFSSSGGGSSSGSSGGFSD